MKKYVLFVCTGNTCRSPLAEVWFNKCADDLGLEGFIAGSAGLLAIDGAPASVNSAAVAEENAVSLQSFLSRNLTREMVEDSYMIIGMTDSHCRKIISAMPEAEAKVYNLLEFTGGGNVGDPYGGSLDDYRECFAVIKRAVGKLVDTLKEI